MYFYHEMVTVYLFFALLIHLAALKLSMLNLKKKKIAGHCYKLFYIIHGIWHGSVAERSKALV
jgi:hypothetical protein